MVGNRNNLNLFICLELPKNLKKDIIELQKAFPRNNVILLNKEKLHVTIAYFSEVIPKKEIEIINYISKLKHSKYEIDLIFNGSISHGSWTRVNDPSYQYNEFLIQCEEQIRLDLVANEKLLELRNNTIQFAKNTELIPSDFSNFFSPHITICESKFDFLVEEISNIKFPKKIYRTSTLTLQQEINRMQYKKLFVKK